MVRVGLCRADNDIEVQADVCGRTEPGAEIAGRRAVEWSPAP